MNLYTSFPEVCVTAFVRSVQSSDSFKHAQMVFQTKDCVYVQIEMIERDGFEASSTVSPVVFHPGPNLAMSSTAYNESLTIMCYIHAS